MSDSSVGRWQMQSVPAAPVENLMRESSWRMNELFTGIAWEDYLYWQATDKKIPEHRLIYKENIYVLQCRDIMNN
jgi:hypothetical protein